MSDLPRTDEVNDEDQASDVLRHRSLWTCPWCATVWLEQPLEDGVVGCPECGSVDAEELEP